jgi:beta-lactamase class A
MTRLAPRSRPAHSRARRARGKTLQSRSRDRGPALVPLALVLIGLFAVVHGWGALGSTAEALRSLAFSRPAVTGFVAPAERLDTLLQARIANTATLPGGTVGVAVRDLEGGLTATLNGDRPFPAASLFKLPILVEVLKQQRLNRLNADDRLQILQAHWTDGSGVLQARIGERLPIHELLRLMVQESDNIAALVLLDAVGVENVNATMDAMGLRATRLRDRRQPQAVLHTTSARDMAHLLETIATGRLIDVETSEAALELLERKQAHTWLTDGLPWWVKLAHKWGDLPGARHDAGIVFAPSSTYLAVVLTEGGTPRHAQQVIAETSRAVFEHLGG